MATDIEVQVDGRAVRVPPGATVVAALMMAAQPYTRRSTSGEIRFAVCGMGQCQECRMTINGLPHQLACQVRCEAGMSITTGQSREQVPSIKPGSVHSFPATTGVRPLLSSGKSGLTPVEEAAVVVIGAGPAGMAAAAAASAGGRSVVLIDDNPTVGGQIWRGGPAQWADPRAARLWDLLRQRPHVRVLGGARVVAAPAPRTLLLDTATGPLMLAWHKLILCSGARELLLPFPGWTLPGVTGAGGMQALIKGGMPVSGKRVVVAGSGPLLLAVADTVRRNGGEVVAIAEHRSRAELGLFAARLAMLLPAKLVQAAGLMRRLRGVPYLRNATVSAAIGEDRLAAVRLDEANGGCEIACDFLACGYGLVPALELAAMLGCAVQGGRVVVGQHGVTSIEGVWAAGESTGIGGVDKALAEGRIAGLATVAQAPSRAERRALASSRAFAHLLQETFGPTPALRALSTPSTIVCRCEDVRAQQLQPHPDWRTAKLQTRVGMGPCQGRVCGAACQFLYGWEEAGARPPMFPVSAQTLASVGEA